MCPGLAFETWESTNLIHPSKYSQPGQSELNETSTPHSGNPARGVTPVDGAAHAGPGRNPSRVPLRLPLHFHRNRRRHLLHQPDPAVACAGKSIAERSFGHVVSKSIAPRAFLHASLSFSM